MEGSHLHLWEAMRHSCALLGAILKLQMHALERGDSNSKFMQQPAQPQVSFPHALTAVVE